ncbi:MAG: hypothetical protein NXI23_17225 [Bacteroidetes bacterium]|jgi:hypothetical protein|nr:hypothetical protein [Bacteroidota bacterium]
MKKITPFASVTQAMKSLDNGGRFFNFFTEANDGVISGAELSKAVGLGRSYQSLMLFLQMSLSKLDEFGQQKVLSKLNDKLKKKYQKFKAQEIPLSEVESTATVSSSVLLTGVPRLKESKTEFSGFIYVPIQAGDVTSFMMVPIMDQYDVYDLTDENSGESFVIAHIKGKEKLPEKSIKVGGILKELKTKAEKESGSTMYMDAAYHI